MLKRVWIVALLLTSNCTPAKQLPNGAEVLPGSLVESMLAQCSRLSPEKGEGTWSPGASEVADLEARLPKELPTQLQKSGWVEDIKTFPTFPSGFRRQYVGIIRHGRKYIYGNFSPRGAFSDLPPEVLNEERVMMVCDGGPVFFGAEFDSETKQFTHWGFNGVA